MQEALRTHAKIIGILVSIVAFLGLLTYSLVSPHGFSFGLSNDLKAIEQPEGSTYFDLDGNPVSLVDFKGESLIINAWASWIPFSQSELKLLALVKADKGDAVTVLAINRMENAETVKAYLEYIGKPEGIIFLVDPSDTFYKAVSGYAMPETVFYDRDGVIAVHKRGVLTPDELNSFTEQIVTE